MSSLTKGILLSLAMLVGVLVGIELLTTAFEERDARTQEQDQVRH
jgi:hypothetical protein